MRPFERIQKEDSQLKGSGQRALETNQEGLDKIQKELADLKTRFENGENVLGEMQKLKKLREKLLEDRGRISEAGI
jgi:superfamily II RNA helicase